MSLSTWLRDYLYFSLGGNKKGKFRTYFNLLLTMLLGGLWHGASLRFILWGGLHGAALAVHKAFSSIPTKPLPKKWNDIMNVLGVLLTFHFVCFCWIFFRAPDMASAGQMLSQIFTHFSPHVFGEFVSGYKIVLLIMVLGYLLHFVPKSIELKAEQTVTAMPLALKTILLVGMIVLVIQTKSAGIQPFIYFQF